jgi:hypothetical protein
MARSLLESMDSFVLDEHLPEQRRRTPTSKYALASTES